MKAFVITLENNSKSLEAAERCIRSAKNYGVYVERSNAVTADKAKYYANSNAINYSEFFESWSRHDRALACFCSHFDLWKRCVEIEQEPIMILEHDAAFVSNVEYDKLNFKEILNIGKPSYGSFNCKDQPGIYPSFSKNNGAYLGGAHAYIVKPVGARKLMLTAKDKAMPTDIFISNKNFYVEELYPWPVEAHDWFSTVQNEKGCKAKHNFNEDYLIV